MQPVLLVFIDSFPYYCLDKAPFLASLPYKARVIPGFGYSSTCQIELFSGLTPDDVGYFGEWTYEPESSPFRRWRWFLEAASLIRRLYPLDGLVQRGFRRILVQEDLSLVSNMSTADYMARPFYYLDRALHRAVDRILGLHTKNIPLSYLVYLNHPYISVFDHRFPYDSLLKHPNIVGIYTYAYKLPWYVADAVVYQRAKEVISELPESKHLVVSMTKLDNVGHRFGTSASQYRDKVAELDRWVEDLYQRFLARFPSGRLAVISDHGMVDVSQGVTVDIEKVFGRPRPGKYFYFLEGTILRIWTDKHQLLGEMLDYLHRLGIGTIVSRAERASFGLKSSRFGNIIFVINEPLMFVNSFWGNRVSRGMHGYHPLNPSQHGVFLMSSDSVATLGDERVRLRTVDVYRKLRALLKVSHEPA